MSSSVSDNIPVQMNPEVAKQLFIEGGTLVFLNVPPGTEFGIDMNVFNVGEKFRGVKMIPPGLHFIYYSAVSKEGQSAPRTGFFHYFSPREIVLKKWDKRAEDISEIPVTEEEKENIKRNLTELDSFLGVYPYHTWKKWISLIGYISEPLLKKLQPESEVVSSVTQLIPLSYPPEPEKEQEEKQNTRVSRSLEDMYLPNMKIVPGTEIRFTKIPTSKYPTGSSASEITKHNLDSTYTLEQMLDTYSKQEDFLGELQMAFVCFLVAHVYDAFEQWQKLVHMMCTCDSGLERYSSLFSAFIGVMHFHIQEIPKDFFVDIVTQSNFLTSTLHIFFENIKGSKADRNFCEKAMRFKENLTKKFKWDFDSVPEDEVPVIVDL